jgi:cytochrome c551/c552
MRRNVAKVVTLASVLLLVVAGIALADDGKLVFTSKNCDTCHSVSTAGIKAKIESLKGPDLVDLAKKFDAEKLSAFICKQAAVEGEEHGREFKGSDEEKRVLVEWLLEQKKS